MIDAEADAVSSRPLLVERTERGFKVFDATLGISAEASSADEAFDRLRSARDEVHARCRAAGIPLAALRAPSEAARATRGLLRPGIALTLGIVLGIVIQVATQRISAASETFGALTEAREVGRRVADLVAALGTAAETMPPEREAQLREDLRRIVRRTAPIVRELQPLIASVFVEIETEAAAARRVPATDEADRSADSVRPDVASRPD